MMELKVYQRNALDAFSRWLETLEDTQHELETMVEMLSQSPTDIPIPDELRNYPKAAWKKLKENGDVAATAGEHVDRTDDANRPIPHICFKVPTECCLISHYYLPKIYSLKKLKNEENITQEVTKYFALNKISSFFFRSYFIRLWIYSKFSFG